MNCKTAIELDLIKLLASLNYFPTKQIKHDVWYFSPFRNERTPSFKVCTKINRWYDHALGEGGDVINLIVRLKNITNRAALKFLKEQNLTNSFSFQKQSFMVRSQNPSFKIKKLIKIQNPALIGYLKSRKLDVNEARKYCEEIYYTFDGVKTFFGIAFRNDCDGFECRSKYFKGCLVNKNITSIFNESKTLCVFESFTDFLSYRTLKLTELKEDYVILNSTNQINNCLPLLDNYNVIKGYMDADPSGKECSKIIKEHCNNEFQDCSNLYANYKDLNEYLMALGK